MDAVSKVIAALEADLGDRRMGFDQIDDDIKDEIRAAWRTILEAHMPMQREVIAQGHVTRVQADTKLGLFVGTATVSFGSKEADFGLTEAQANRLLTFFKSPAPPVAATLVFTPMRPNVVTCTCSYEESEEMTRHAPLCALTKAGRNW